jgi:hypothetical protein
MFGPGVLVFIQGNFDGRRFAGLVFIFNVAAMLIFTVPYWCLLLPQLHSFITFQLTDRNMFNVYHKFIKFYHGSLDCLLTPNTSADSTSALHQLC